MEWLMFHHQFIEHKVLPLVIAFGLGVLVTGAAYDERVAASAAEAAEARAAQLAAARALGACAAPTQAAPAIEAPFAEVRS